MYKRSEVEKNAIDYFNDDLTAKVWMDKYALKNEEEELMENHPTQTIDRMVNELHRIELTYKNPMEKAIIYDLLKDYNKLVLGGSCLFGIGNNYKLSTLGNCFVVDSPYDSYAGILKTDEQLAQLMKRRGGVGVDVSTIRYKGSKVNNAATTSTGVVPFMERYSNTTREVAQEGRRGALMLSISVDHPDIEEVITAKDNLNKITGANISIRITDDFMLSVETGDPRATKIWNKIIHQAWKTAEPGLLFWDRIIQNSPADCYSNFRTISTNPCSELPLCAYDSCRLASINLYAYVVNPFQENCYFDLESFTHDVIFAQRIMDNIIDLENEKIIAILNKIGKDPEPDNLKHVERELWTKIQYKLLGGRRTGLGLMGLADTFAALNMKFGSDESIRLAENIAKNFAISSYISSIIMAKERGAFLDWNLESEIKHPYLNRIFDKIWDEESTDWWEDYKIYGRRNIANLTIAPTGSISMLAKTSSGIEPVFALSYTRKRKVTEDNENKTYKDKNGDSWEEYEVSHPAFQTWKLQHPNGETSPYVESTAHEINPFTKIKLQAAIQPYIDHSISVTYNLSKDTKEEQVSDLYFRAWKSGLKGITVYRDGSREGILTTGSIKPTVFKQTNAPKRPKVLLHDIYNIKSKGQPWTICVGIYDNKPYEVFAFNHINFTLGTLSGEMIKQTKGRYDLHVKDIGTFENITEFCSDEENLLTRMISTSLRHGADIKFVVEQLKKSKGDITSFGLGIARVLNKYVKESTIKPICPDCGSEMVIEGGCAVCKNCGNNKCN